MNSIKLPITEIAPLAKNSLYYGADKLVCEYLGLRNPPCDTRGYWTHGWETDYICVEPDLALGIPIKKLSGTAWVGKKNVERYLLENGCKAKAIGLPIAYLPEKKYQRRKGSLLVMPSHSMEYTKHAWNFRKYAQEIAEIRDLFDEVAVCLNAGCIKNGYWIKEFKEIGVPVIEGANLMDRNALERMRALLSQFEYMTTNGFGSHIAYGAAFGAKVSIYGTFCEFEEEDFKDDNFFCEVPGLVKTSVQLSREKFVRKHLGEFFCHPCRAVERVDWGLEQIGYHNRISPAEMRRCFGLEWHRKPLEKLKKNFFKLAKRALPYTWYRELEEAQDLKQREENREIRRLEALPPENPGTAVFDGRVLHFLRPKQFLDDYFKVFKRRQLDVPCIKANPMIIDWGSGTGMGLRYWAQKFPSPEIHAYEPCMDKREVLRRNIELASNAKIVLYKDAEVLSDLLEQSVDFLRLDIGTAGSELFLAISKKLANVDKLILTVETDFLKPQRVSQVLAVLETAGFRYHLVSLGASGNAFLRIEAKGGADCRVDVWAYRGEKFPWTSVV